MMELDTITKEKSGWNNICPSADYCAGAQDPYYFYKHCKDNIPGCSTTVFERLENLAKNKNGKRTEN